VSVLIVFRIVTSCPPPGPAVEVKAPAYLPARAPVDQREEVESQKACVGARELIIISREKGEMGDGDGEGQGRTRTRTSHESERRES
jgi:hypothetical protein